MNDFVVRRWSRSGTDWLSVSTRDGVRIGWRDLTTGETAIHSVQHADALEALLATWDVADPEATPATVAESPA